MDGRAAVLLQLSLDDATAEAVRAMRQQGVHPILLKGPVIAGWLYPRPSDRPYRDIDLLVRPDDFVKAEAVLSELGYASTALGLRGGESVAHERHWVRAGRSPAEVDLHRSLFWAGVEPMTAWALLSGDLRPIVVGGMTVDTLVPAARAVVLALHAASHGKRARQPLADLELASARLDVATWLEAAALAEQLGAGQPFAAGLRLVPEGRDLAVRLGLSADSSIEVRLRSSSGPPTSVGFEHLHQLGSTRARARFVLINLFPSPAFMRLWKPLARRGPCGLVMAYVWRPFWLAYMFPGGLQAWFRSRREAVAEQETEPPQLT